MSPVKAADVSQHIFAGAFCVCNKDTSAAEIGFCAFNIGKSGKLCGNSIALSFCKGVVSAADTQNTAPVVNYTVTGDEGTLAYKVNPSERAVFGVSSTDYAGTSLTSGTTEIAAVAGNVIEVAAFGSDGKLTKVGYITVTAANIKA